MSVAAAEVVPLDAVSNPRRELWAGGAIIALFGIGFVGWSALTPLDAALQLPGIVKVAGDRQAVQTADGGVISAIRVDEGDRVRAGEVLVEFAAADAIAAERALARRVWALQAELARISAEGAGAGQVAPPAEWLALDAEDRPLALAALATEQAALASQRNLSATQAAVVRQRLAQLDSQTEGYRRRMSSNDRQERITDEELRSTRYLFEKGYATKTRVLALERSAAALDGEGGAMSAEIGRLHASAGESRLQLGQLEVERRQANLDRARVAHTELQTLLPQWRAAREQRNRSTVRAPASGTVIGLVAKTLGGVAPAGAQLMEIVPDDRGVTVEVQLPAADGGQLRVGQHAEVRMVGPDAEDAPPLDGTVRRVSPDSVADERTGRSFYLASVVVPAAARPRAGEQGLRPGVPVQVVVPLRSRTALQYWVSPLTRRLSDAMHAR